MECVIFNMEGGHGGHGQNIVYSEQTARASCWCLVDYVSINRPEVQRQLSLLVSRIPWCSLDSYPKLTTAQFSQYISAHRGDRR